GDRAEAAGPGETSGGAWRTRALYLRELQPRSGRECGGPQVAPGGIRRRALLPATESRLALSPWSLRRRQEPPGGGDRAPGGRRRDAGQLHLSAESAALRASRLCGQVE